MEFLAAKVRSENKNKIETFFKRRRNAKSFFFQPKLTIGPVDDPYEREADTVAEKVMLMSDHDEEHLRPKISPLNLQRKCAECEEEEKQLQKKGNGNGPDDREVPSLVSSVINSSGKSLDPGTKSFMESRFDYDFSGIKIHTDEIAAKSARSINALAYTSGNNIVFNEGQYSPETEGGKKLLAHELTHVVQQRSVNSGTVKQINSVEELGSSHKGVVQKSDDPYMPLTPFPNSEKSGVSQPFFKCGRGNLSKNDIATEQSFYDNGGTFNFGHSNPPLFSWENEVSIHGGPDVDYGNWQVGMVQLMKDYWLNIWWGDETDSVHCGGGFPDVMVRDVKDERSSSAWFNGTGSGPFAFDGDKKTISIVDSPGALSVPYHHFNQKTDANFGHFNFGCTFFTYISAFNYANPQSPDAWKHIKSVYWQTMLAGQFDQRLPSDQRLKVTDGGLTEIGEVMKGHPKTFPPRLDGKTGHDITCPILKCWSPKQKCRQIIE